MLRLGIVGLPNVGKSTLFNALTSSKAAAAENYPFCTVEPNVGVVEVPDPRLDRLFEIVAPRRRVPAAVEFLDIAGLVRGASQGEGLGNQFLGNIKNVDAIIHVIRCFDDENVIHVDGSVNPVRDKEIIDAELQLKDLESIDKKLGRIEKQARIDPKFKVEYDVLVRCKDHLEKGKSIRELNLTKEERPAIADLFLLTEKPVLYVANVDEASMHTGNKFSAALQEAVKGENAQVIIMNNSIEAQISEMEDPADKQMFMEEYKMTEPALDRLIHSAYKLLNLYTYFTAGVQEVRAWTIHEGWKAPQAAGVIHTDFEKGFIKAEVISYDDFIQYGSESAARDNGRLRIEGKEYVVKDGDVIYFRFNV